jgi:hypothetical protein
MILEPELLWIAAWCTCMVIRVLRCYTSHQYFFCCWRSWHLSSNCEILCRLIMSLCEGFHGSFFKIRYTAVKFIINVSTSLANVGLILMVQLVAGVPETCLHGPHTTLWSMVLWNANFPGPEVLCIENSHPFFSPATLLGQGFLEFFCICGI